MTIYWTKLKAGLLMIFIVLNSNMLPEAFLSTLKQKKKAPQLSVRQADVYRMLREPGRERWDLVLIDVDHSPDEHLGSENQSFYTEPGLRLAKEHLASGGIMAVWSYAESSRFVDAMHSVFEFVDTVQVDGVNDLIDDGEFTDWLFIASDSPFASVPI